MLKQTACTNPIYKEYCNGSIYHINFGRTFHPELKDKHLGILFTMKSTSNMIFCLPLTSPKEKHFNTVKSFTNRDYHDLKYPHLYYIKETDSIVMFDQFRTISKNRIESQYKDPKQQNKVVLTELEQQRLIKSFKKFFKSIID